MARVNGSSPWTRVDLTAAGMFEPVGTDGEFDQCHDWLVFASAAWRGQSFLVWQQLRGIGQFLDIVLANLHDRAMAGDLADPESGTTFDPLDAFTVATTEIQVIFGVPEARARALVNQAIAASERLPGTADLLRDGLISPEMFAAVVVRTAIVEEARLMGLVDRDLALALVAAGHTSVKKAEAIADRIVARHDPGAVARRREKAAAKKNMTTRNLGDGLAGIFLTTDAVEARLCFAAVDAMATAVCPADPRSLRVRRSAAATAALRRQPFTCGCPDTATCTSALANSAQGAKAADAGTGAAGAAGDDDGGDGGEGGDSAGGGGLSPHQARIVIHAICQKSTLEGEDEEPGWLDGHGVIDAGYARELADRPEATVRDLDLDVFTDPEQPAEDPLIIEAHTHQGADPYRPTAALDTLVRGMFLTCTIPGCERPAWNCELDHVEEFNNLCPQEGGPTCLCNINPKCKLHHVMKTHLGATDPAEGFLDDLWFDEEPFTGAHADDGSGTGTLGTTITTPHGITVHTGAPGSWMFPQLRAATCQHKLNKDDPPADATGRADATDRVDPACSRAPAEPAGSGDPPPPAPTGGLAAATAYKHAWRRAQRARIAAQSRKDPPPF